MSKKTQKKGGFTQKQVQANAARLETTCDLLAGPGYYTKLPNFSKALILENRYNPVKLIGSSDKTVK